MTNRSSLSEFVIRASFVIRSRQAGSFVLPPIVKYRWSLLPPNPLLAGQLARSLSISPLLAQCLINRGLSDSTSISGFLDPRLKQLADPFLIPNMAAAVERLMRARERNEALVIFGDYDVDGVTSTALLAQTLRPLGWTVHSYLPHRMDEGYGLTQDAVENCLKKYPVTLFLAVDCGSTTVDSIAWLQGRGVDVIVVDHHQVSTPAPAPFALVNPRAEKGECSVFSVQCSDPSRGQRSEVGSQPSDEPQVSHDGLLTTNPPFADLCSVGLAFKLAHALVKRAREAATPGAADFDIRPLLDLVALGTIADIVPLTGENRILVSAGLERLNSTKRPGLVALKAIAKSPKCLGTYEVGFQLAPRLNAAGRLETAEESLHLLLANDPAEAAALARNLDGHNRERQAIERRIADEVITSLRTKFDPAEHFVIVEGNQSWHNDPKSQTQSGRKIENRSGDSEGICPDSEKEPMT
jgi:single-stranded-DNA-specific exonuclease